jgi:TrmH family RNA methyltransferase
VSEAGGASGVVADVGCADPFGWKALRGAMGSTLRLPILAAVHAADAVADARRAGCRILATAPRGGRDVFSVDLRRSVAVLIGGEGRGLVPELLEAADERIMIPMQPPVDSLNAATTAAVIVYEARRQRALRQVL